MKKRLVLVVTSFPKLSETFIVNKFLGLLDLGWDVHVVCGQSEPDEWLNFSVLSTYTGIKKRVHVTWSHKPKYFAALLIPAAFLRLLIHAPKRTLIYLHKGYRKFGLKIIKFLYLDSELILLDPTIVHFEFGALAVGKTYIKTLLGTNLSVSFRGYDLNFAGLDKSDYYSEVWQAIDACHFLGQDLWQRAKKRGCPENMPYMLIPPALKLDEFPVSLDKCSENIGMANRPVRLLSVGRLEWKKGYEHALASVKLLLDKGFKCTFKIVGNGDFRESILFTINDLGIQENVELCGGLDHAKVVEMLAWADIFLHPSLSEGFCNAVLEAQAMGVPVVCSDAGDLPSNVSDGHTGYVVPRRNPQAMAEKITVLLKNPDIRKDFGVAGLERVKNYFSLDQHIAAWDTFYRKLL